LGISVDDLVIFCCNLDALEILDSLDNLEHLERIIRMP
jgi:hypothetical protein